MMKTILPNRTLTQTFVWIVVVGLSQGRVEGQVETPETPVTSSELLLRSAGTLAAESSFQAEFRHRVRVLGQEMVGKGVYRQANLRQRRKYRLEITLRVGDESSSIQQASNGRFLWVRRDFPGQRNVTRLDLREVRQAVQSAKAGPADPQGGGIQPIGLEGLPSTLAGFVERFDFTPPRETLIGDEPAWLIEGRWKSAALKSLAPAYSVNDPHLNRLPAHIPTHLVVVLSRSPQWPLFPYRIEYRRAAERFTDHIRNTQPLVTMEFFNVLRRAQFDEREFEFPESDGKEEDITSEYIKRLAER